MSRFKALLDSFAQSTFAVAIGFAATTVLMVIYGYNPVLGYILLFTGAFGTLPRFLESVAFAVPVMLTAVTFAIGIRAGIFNIGAEGQVYLGAIGAVIAGGAISLAPGLHLLVATGFAMLLGGLWGLIAAILKVARGVHEVISTIMLNWIALYLVAFLVANVFVEPGRAEKSLPALESARYQVLLRGATLTTVIFVALAFSLATYLLLWRTKTGFEVRLVGNNPDAAKYAGISVSRAIIVSFVVGGLAAGLAGASQILGRPPAWSLYGTLGNVVTLGFQGIGVALIGRNHPLGIIIASLFYGGLLNGGRFMEKDLGLADELIQAINGIIIMTLAFPEILKIVRRKVVE